MHYWVREGEFFPQQKGLVRLPARNAPVQMTDTVVFRHAATLNTVVKRIVLKIQIIRYSDGDVIADLTPSPLFFQEIKDLCRSYLRGYLLRQRYDTSSVKFQFNKHSLIHLEELFEYVHQNYHPGEFTEDLVTELKIISGSLEPQQKNPVIYKHKMQEKAYPSHVHPDRKQSTTLVDLLFSYPVQGCQKTLRKKTSNLLSRGEPPNQLGLGGRRPLGLAVLSRHLNVVVKPLVIYGANFLLPEEDISGLSAMEVAKKCNNVDMLNLFVSLATHPEKPLRNTVYLESLDVISNDTETLTVFTFSDNCRLFSCLKEIKNLSVFERDQLFQIYATFFETPDGNVKEPFDRTFSPEKGNMLELIRNDKQQIVGAVSFKIRIENGTIWAVVDIGFIHPRYSSYSVMAPLTYRLPFCLQLLYPEHEIIIELLFAHYSGMRRVQFVLGSPRYQSGDQEQPLIKRMVDASERLFNCKLVLVCDGASVCYVKEEKPTMVKGLYQSSSLSLMEEHYQLLRNSDSGTPDEIRQRDVPFVAFVGDKFVLHLQKMFAPRRMNFHESIRLLTLKLSRTSFIDGALAPIDREQVRKVLANGQRREFFDSVSLFWYGKRVRVQLPDMSEPRQHQNQMARC